MITSAVQASKGACPFDILIRNIRIVNVFTDSAEPGCIGIAGDRIAYAGPEEPDMKALHSIDGNGQWALPGFVDAHMHLESSMLTPDHFARIALSHGTTTVAADPHEITNVMGPDGVQALTDACRDLPLRVLVMAPSTVPSSPGFEDSGCSIGAAEAGKLLDLPGVWGLGEVMDFNAVAEGDPHILSVIEEAHKRNCLIDGHASVLTGRRLQTFRAAGIDSDHTLGTAEKLHEELALGFCVQIQEAMLNKELVKAMNEAPVQNRICLVTDDVPLPRLMKNGHLNHVVARAIELGLDPIRAVRFATINPAERLRLYHTGAIAPGMTADIQLVKNLERPEAELVLCSGKIVWENGRFISELPGYHPPKAMLSSLHIRPLREEDFEISCCVPPSFHGGTGLINLIGQDGVSFRTRHLRKTVRLSPEKNGRARAETAPLLKMAVCNRYGKQQRGLALLNGMDNVTGAAALTYGHDSHNLTIFGGNDADMAAAANALIRTQGGLCTARNGNIETLVPLPLAGLLSPEAPEVLLKQLEAFLDSCRNLGFSHQNLLSFFTIMPLAVSPEIKCTDRGLLDVVHKRFLPLVEQIKEDI